MAGLDNTGFRILNPFCFALGIFAPEHIDNRSIKSINPLNNMYRNTPKIKILEYFIFFNGFTPSFK